MTGAVARAIPVVAIALAAVAAGAQEYPKPAIRGGFAAPEWAMQLGGAAIAVVHNNKDRQVRRF